MGINNLRVNQKILRTNMENGITEMDEDYIRNYNFGNKKSEPDYEEPDDEDTDEEEQNAPKSPFITHDTTEVLKEFGETELPPKGKSKIHCLTIIGQIEGHMILPQQNKTTKYEHIIPQLVAIEESPDIEGLLVILNTVGGDVEGGLAVAELLGSMSKPTVSLVLGGGHSIGVPIAVSCKYSFIAPSATMTIHPIRMNGMIIGVPQTYEYFEKMQERVVQFISSHTRITKEELRKLMLKTGEIANDVGTVVFGEEAVNYGLINQVGGISDALDKLHSLIKENNEKDDNNPTSEANNKIKNEIKNEIMNEVKNEIKNDANARKGRSKAKPRKGNDPD